MVQGHQEEPFPKPCLPLIKNPNQIPNPSDLNVKNEMPRETRRYQERILYRLDMRKVKTGTKAWELKRETAINTSVIKRVQEPSTSAWLKKRTETAKQRKQKEMKDRR